MTHGDVGLTTITLGGRTARVAVGHSGGADDPAAHLLASAALAAPGEQTVDLNVGAGLAALAEAWRPTHRRLWAAAATTLDLEAAEQTLAANGLSAVTVALGTGLAAFTDLPAVDLALLRLPRGAWPTKQSLWDAYRTLRPGGRLLLAGGTDEGVKTALRLAALLFENVAVMAYGKGHRVASAMRGADRQPLPIDFADPLLDHTAFHGYAVATPTGALEVRVRPGIFAWDHLDAGSAMLLAAMRVEPGERVLDLGGGSGILGAAAARMAGPNAVTLLETSADAVASARATLAANDLRATVLAGHSPAALGSARYDVVVTNPPFHHARAEDRQLAVGFVQLAAAVLQPSGRLYLVANRFLPYETALRQHFRHVEVTAADRRYKVLLATGPRA